MSTTAQPKSRIRGRKSKLNIGSIVQSIETHPGGFSLNITMPLVSVPDEINNPRKGASVDMQRRGLIPVFTGATTARNAFVASQKPKGYTVVPRGTTVTMRLVSGPTP
jgi:hypothetical protein